MTKANTKQEKVTGKSLTYYQAVDLMNLLNRPGFNTKELSSDNFLDMHYLKLNLKKKVTEIADSVDAYAKETDHEAVPIGNGIAIYKLRKKQPKKKGEEQDYAFEKATEDFNKRKQELEGVKIEGLKLNFMTLAELRSWTANVEGQFELTEHLLSEDKAPE